jgi:DNA-binding transcriptional LysR family regulator
MELRHLRYFVAVAEELNFHRAAERLRVAQPAVSAQIKALEEDLQVTLFERTTRSIRLTQAGGVLLAKARELLGSVEQTRLLTRRAWEGAVGLLRLGVIPPAASPWLSRILRQYHQRYPAVQLVISECTSSEQIRQLRAGELDAGFLRPPVEFADLEWRFVEEAFQVLVAPPNHRLMRKRGLEWKDFDGEGLVMIEPNQQHGFYDAFLAACAEAGARVYPAHYAHDIQIIMWLVSAGFGIAPTTASLSQIQRPGVVYRPLPPGLPPVRTVLAWRRDNNSSVLMNFLKCFTEYQNAGHIKPRRNGGD